jgi:glycine/D-amino acid oxidase-like deaminating enzyme
MSSRYEQLSFWLSQAAPITPRPSLTGDVDADVAIIGAGFTGLWTAYYLAQADPTLRIVILERTIAAGGASGRNGGFCVGYVNGRPERYADQRGEAAARALRLEMSRTPDEIGGVLEKEGIDAGFRKTGTLSLARTHTQVARQKEALADRTWSISPEADYRWLDAAEAKERVNIPGLLGATFEPQVARVQPALLARGLAEAVERHGVTIYEETEVTDIGHQSVVTPRGTVSAKHVIRATEGYSEGLPSNNRRLLAFTSQVVVTEPLAASVWDEIGMADNALLTDSDRLFVYMQRTMDDRIAIGGKYTYRPWRPTRIEAEKSFLVRRNFTLIEQALRELFPAAANARIAHRWGGIWGAARDFCPTVSYDPERHFGWAGGYGDGVCASNLAGRCLTDLVLGRDTAYTNLGWINHDARSWPPDPLPALGAKLIAASFNRADQAERAGRSAPSWVRLAEAMVPK